MKMKKSEKNNLFDQPMQWNRFFSDWYSQEIVSGNSSNYIPKEVSGMGKAGPVSDDRIVELY